MKNHGEQLDSASLPCPEESEETWKVLKDNYQPMEPPDEFDFDDDILTRSLTKEGITTEKKEWVFSHIGEKNGLRIF